MRPPPLLDVIGTPAYESLAQVNGPLDRAVATWLDGWYEAVGRFFDESALPREAWTDTTGHRHDWVGALHMRDVVARALVDHLAEIPGAATSWLADVDGFMRTFTEFVEDWAPEEDRTDDWWWSRLPVRGPVRAGWWASDS